MNMSSASNEPGDSCVPCVDNNADDLHSQLMNTMNMNYKLFKELINRKSKQTKSYCCCEKSGSSNIKPPGPIGMCNNHFEMLNLQNDHGQCLSTAEQIQDAMTKLCQLKDCIEKELQGKDYQTTEKKALLDHLNKCFSHTNDDTMPDKALEDAMCEIEMEELCLEIEKYKESLKWKGKLLTAFKKYIVALKRQHKLCECYEGIERQRETANDEVKKLQQELEMLKSQSFIDDEVDDNTDCEQIFLSCCQPPNARTCNYDFKIKSIEKINNEKPSGVRSKPSEWKSKLNETKQLSMQNYKLDQELEKMKKYTNKWNLSRK